MPESKFTLLSSSSNCAVKTWRCHLEKPYELEPYMYNRCAKVADELSKEVMKVLEMTTKNAEEGNIFKWHLRVKPNFSSYDLAAIDVRVPMYFETKPKPFYLGDIGDEELMDDVFNELHRIRLLYEIDEYEHAVLIISYMEIHTVRIRNSPTPGMFIINQYD